MRVSLVHVHVPPCVRECEEFEKKRGRPTVKAYPLLHRRCPRLVVPRCLTSSRWGGGDRVHAAEWRHSPRRQLLFCVPAIETQPPAAAITSREAGSGERASSKGVASRVPPKNRELCASCFTAVSVDPPLNSSSHQSTKRAIWLCGSEQIAATSLRSLVNQAFTR